MKKCNSKFQIQNFIKVAYQPSYLVLNYLLYAKKKPSLKTNNISLIAVVYGIYCLFKTQNKVSLIAQMNIWYCITS